jgi:hypothetical protein
MRPGFVRSAGVGAVILIAGFAATAFRSSDAGANREVVRLRAHFDSVDLELRGRDVSRLTPAQRERRATLVRWLKEYRNAGVFPVNDKFAGQFVPFFRDSRGVQCAMAYLIDRSGRRDIVDKVARTRNNAYVRELADDPALIEWLDDNGLTVSEAARIQPQYEGITPGAPDRVSSDFAIATLVLGGGSLASTGVNLVKPTLTGEIVGILVGGGAIVNGIAHLDENRGTKRVANASIIAGSVGVAASVAAFAWPRIRSQKSAVVANNSRNFMITPSIVPTSNSYSLGVGASAKF